MHDRLSHLGYQSGGGEVIQKVQRLRTADRDVIDAVVDQIFADGIMPVDLDGHFNLCTYAIHGGDQYRLRPFGQIERIEAAEGPHIPNYVGGKR